MLSRLVASFATRSARVSAGILPQATTVGGAQPKLRLFSSSSESGSSSTNNDNTAPKEAGPTTEHSFQAETQQLLRIVANSLYTDKEVFIRELISNASDALEKLRYTKSSGAVVAQSERELKVSIEVDEKANTFVIQDTGIGMTEEELIANLGTIARSGSRAFIEQLKKQGNANETGQNIIGQFGVGFYSAFMVGDKITVYTRSFAPDSQGYKWESDGSGKYTITPATGVTPGTRIEIQLRGDCTQFANREVVSSVVKKFSNFVNFPVYLNNDKVTTVGALWMREKSSVKDEEHEEFYRFLTHAGPEEKPRSWLHFQTDAPLSINSLFYIPQRHTERLGMGRMEPGVNLYSRRVLIQQKSKLILPDWLRFVKGVVDSEDFPLNLSREHLQDSALIRRLNGVLTRRILRWLDEEGRKRPEWYEEFYREFGNFLKEGLVVDFDNKADIAKLLRYETSSMAAGKVSSLADYVGRIPETQKEIYYLLAPSREFALSSPYYEVFEKQGKEVIFSYQSADDFVFNALGEFMGKKVVNIETSEAAQEQPDNKPTGRSLDEKECTELASWLQANLGDRLLIAKPSKRLFNSPAIIVDHVNASYRRMMQLVDSSNAPSLGLQTLEFNPSHPVILGLYDTRESNPDIARVVADQMFDNALIVAGLMDNSRTMVDRLNRLMEVALRSSNASSSSSSTAGKQEEVETVEGEPVKS